MTRTMTPDELERFEGLIQKTQSLGDENPRGYLLRVAALSLLAPVLFIALGAVAVALVVGAGLALIDGDLIFGVPFLLLAGLMVRVSWIRLSPPAGHRLNLENYPRLRGEINEYRAKLATVPIHEVRIGSGFAIEVLETPLFGALPIHRVSLVIGLPLLTLMPSTEAGALIARELAHISRRCGRLHRFVMASRSISLRLMEALAGMEGIFSVPLSRFFDWYAPLLNAYGLALARSYEQKADAVAVSATSVDAVGLALISRTIKLSAAQELFWPALMAEADREREPVADAWTRHAEFCRSFAASREQLSAMMAHSKAPEPGSAEPALRDRLEALKAKPRLPREFRHSAAEKFLGDRYLPWLRKLDEEWADEHLTEWQERYIDTQNAHSRHLDLGFKPQEELTDDELWELATLTERLKGRGEALGSYWAWHKRNPSAPKGELAVGRMLLARGDLRGLKFLERAAEVPELVLEASRAAVEFLTQAGEHLQAQVWRTRANARAQQEQAAARERAGLRLTDTFEPPQLNNDQLRELKLALSTVPGLEEAHIARKKLHHFPERPLYVLACKVIGAQSERVRHQLLDRTHSLAGEVRILFHRGPEAKTAGKVRRTGEKVFALK